MPAELKDLTSADLAKKLDSAGFAELQSVISEKDIGGLQLWCAVWNEINNPTAVVLSPEQITELMSNKEFLLKCLNRVERSVLYAGFNTWRGELLKAKMMAAMADDTDEEEEDAATGPSEGDGHGDG